MRSLPACSLSCIGSNMTLKAANVLLRPTNASECCSNKKDCSKPVVDMANQVGGQWYPMCRSCFSAWKVISELNATWKQYGASPIPKTSSNGST